MSKPTVTMCPTLANPDVIDSVPELRAELHRANGNLLQLADETHELRHVLQGVSQSLARVVFLHMRGHHDAVAKELDVIVTNHVKVTPKQQGGIH
ncbi:hypothetical protein [Pandoraea norimbergensis]|uniref:Uncharacterized protein n=1 Tax=Pandoraea norimbergensis TaxID=93219 RepID=A0ABM5WMV4_9BURK|nr:hypothetical protein [Pandoraea norimbergensis]ALS60696.1 hypothetical protein AT302_13850 [Pandoraea norimbergensis]ALS61963.1 hypothetical protein AT302_21455 [Pandoraea norimbergensis]